MNKPAHNSRSHLFTIRIWEEEIGSDQNEWRGKVQLVTNGDVRYFREWATLASLLLSMLEECQTDTPYPP